MPFDILMRNEWAGLGVLQKDLVEAAGELVSMRLDQNLEKRCRFRRGMPQKVFPLLFHSRHI